jgi:hypothetical protein
MTVARTGRQADRNDRRHEKLMGGLRVNFDNIITRATPVLTSLAMREPYEVCEAKGQKIA